MFYQDPKIRIMVARILNSLHLNKTLTLPEACFAAGKGSRGNRAMKLAHNCYILLGASREFQMALNHLLETDQVVLTKADPKTYGRDSLFGLPLVEKVLTCLQPSWFPVCVALT